MQTSVKERVEKYQESVSQLLKEIRMWIDERGLSAQESDIKISEPRPGTYKVPMLTILGPDGTTLAEIRPEGAWIIGADGRVTIKGPRDNEVLVYWEKGAPLIKTPGIRKEAEPQRRRLFRGADRPGWYWIQDKRLGRALPLDKDLFADLLTEVQPS